MHLILFFLFLSSSLFAQSELPMLIEEITNPETLANQCSASDYQACAKSLCGEPQGHMELQNSTDSFEGYNSQKFGSIPEVERKIKSFIELRRATNQNVLNQIKTDPLFAFKTWDDFRWDRNSFETYSADLEIKYDAKSDVITVEPKTGVQGDAEYIKRLTEFAKRSHNYIRVNPYDLYLKNIVTLDDYHKLEEKKYSFEHAKGSLCPDEACKQDVAKKLGPGFVKTAEEFQKINNNQEEINNLTTKCLSNYIKMAIDQEDIDKFKELLPEAKSDLVNKGMADFSEHSRKVFKEYLETKVDFGFDYDESSSPQRLLEKANKIDNIANEKRIIQDLFSYKESPEYFAPFPEISVCESYSDKNYSDAFEVAEFSNTQGANPDDVLERDKVTLSMRTCRYHKAGKFVVAHELGHALSYAFSKERLSKSSLEAYKKLRKCASESNPHAAAPVRNMHAGDVLTTEEDVADLVAFKTTKGDKDMGMCALFTPKGDQYLQNDDQPLYIEAWKDRVHSLPYVRLVREAIYRLERIPKSCEPVVREYRDTFQDRKLCI